MNNLLTYCGLVAKRISAFDNDLSVPFLHAQNLHKWNTLSKLIVVPESNHVFGASQPWTKTKLPEDFKFVVEKTIAFINSP